MHATFGRVLIRSLRGGDNKRNIDIIFHGVFYLEITLSLDGLRIEDATPEEIEHLEKRVLIDHREGPGAQKYFALGTNSGRFFIGAFDFKVEENDFEAMETSLEVSYSVPHS